VAILAKPDPGVAAISGDLRQPAEILKDFELRALTSCSRCC
jgi:hypothetical protein